MGMFRLLKTGILSSIAFADDIDVDSISVDCYTSPSDPHCSAFTLSADSVHSDTLSICSKFPFLIPCTILSNCDSSQSYSKGFRPDSACNVDRLLQTLCTMELVSHNACSNLELLCATGTLVPFCTTSVVDVPTTKQANSDLYDLCQVDDNKALLPDCSKNCDLKTADTFNSKCGYVKNLVRAANNVTPSPTSATQLKDFCTSNPNMCPPASRSSPCIDNPMLDECKDFKYDPALAFADMKLLCKAMPFMSGCTIFYKCQKDNAYIDENSNAMLGEGSACDLDRLILTTCVYDNMSGMEGCYNYNALCAYKDKKLGDSNVPACKKQQLTYLPTSKEASTLVWDMCHIENHDMESCHSCQFDQRGKYVTGCDPLLSYAQMCQEMPGMDQCSVYQTMCSRVPDAEKAAGSNPPDLFLCDADEINAGPVMMMYFNDKRPFILLFDWWTPKSDGEYAFAVILMLLGGILFEFGQLLRSRFEKFWTDEHLRHKVASSTRRRDSLLAEENRLSPANIEEELLLKPVLNFPGALLVLDLMRGVVHFVLMGLSYVLMLGAMCFNTGIVCAVVGGFAAGVCIFGRFRFWSKKSDDAMKILLAKSSSEVHVDHEDANRRVDCCHA